MRAIDAEELKRSIAVSALIEDQKTLEQIIDEQPTIEERKKGKWNAYYHSIDDISYSCNLCGHSAPYDLWEGKAKQKKWNYCPNCGARMER